jgi:drug/metabolite transporter (DMT)-like permease
MRAIQNGNGLVLPALVLLAGIWGGSFILMKVLVEDISPVQIVAGRLVLGAGAVTLFTLLSGRRFPLEPRLVALTGLLVLVDSVVPFTLVAWAETRIEGGKASVMMSAMPLFTTLFAVAFVREEKLSISRTAGIAVGFLGVIVLTNGNLVRPGHSDAPALLAVVGAAASNGAAVVFARRLLHGRDAIGFSAMKLTLGALVCLPVAMAMHGPAGYAHMGGGSVLALLTLGLLGTGFAYTAYFWVVSRAGSVKASLVTYMIPVSGLLLGAVFLGEHIGISTVAGGAVIASGVALVMFGGAVSVPALLRMAPRVPATATAALTSKGG